MRKERINKFLIKIISTYLSKINAQNSSAPLITIRQIEPTPKNDMIKVWLSFMPLESSFDENHFLEHEIKPHTWAMKKEIAKRMRHITRQVPKEIYFYLDQTAAKAVNLEKLIEEVEK